jgi:hypothetical protein
MPGSTTTPGRIDTRANVPLRVACRLRNGVGARVVGLSRLIRPCPRGHLRTARGRCGYRTVTAYSLPVLPAYSASSLDLVGQKCGYGVKTSVPANQWHTPPSRARRAAFHRDLQMASAYLTCRTQLPAGRNDWPMDEGRQCYRLQERGPEMSCQASLCSQAGAVCVVASNVFVEHRRSSIADDNRIWGLGS